MRCIQAWNDCELRGDKIISTVRVAINWVYELGGLSGTSKKLDNSCQMKHVCRQLADEILRPSIHLNLWECRAVIYMAYATS